VNTLLLLQTAGRASTWSSFISNDWRVLYVCHRQSTYCSNGKYDFCLFKRIYNLIFILVSSIILKKLVNKTNESNINNDIAILGSSFVGALAYTFSDSFGSMQ
jgi:hypothetical protein